MQMWFNIENLLYDRYSFPGSLGESEPILSYFLTFPTKRVIYFIIFSFKKCFQDKQLKLSCIAHCFMSISNANLNYHCHIINIFLWHYNQIVDVDHLRTTLQTKFPLPSILSAHKTN